MRISDVYKYLLSVVNETEYDGTFDVVSFNNIISNENLAFFKRNVEELHKIPKFSEMSLEALFSSKYLKPLAVSKEPVSISGGVVNLSTLNPTYGYFKSMVALTGSSYLKVELVDHEELNERRSNLLKPSLFDQPVCVLEGDSLRLYSRSYTTVYLTYYRKPVNPVLDYYIDSSDNYVFLEAGATGINVPAGGSSSTGVAGPTTVSSSTVELDFDDTFHNEFITSLLVRLGIRNRDQLLTQVAIAKEQQQNAV